MEATVFTTPLCADCKQVTAWLVAQGVRVRVRDLKDDPEAMADLRALTTVRIAPVTVLGGAVYFGAFEDQRQALSAALNALRDPHAHVPAPPAGAC